MSAPGKNHTLSPRCVVQLPAGAGRGLAPNFRFSPIRMKKVQSVAITGW